MGRIKLSDHFNYVKLIRFTFPSIAMMIFTSIYSVVDGYFISNYAGKTPFAAVNLVMPVLMILSSVGFMFGTGGTAIVSKTLGEGDRDKANRQFSLFVRFSFAVGAVFAICGFLFSPQIAELLGAEGDLLEYSVLYERILFLFMPFFVLQVMFQSFFVVAEKANLGFAVTVLSGLINMVLDAVLCIFLPMEYKLTGAALATGIAQTVGGVFPLFYFLRKNDSLLRLTKTTFDGETVWRACMNGSSEFMSNISMSVVGMLFNFQLLAYAGEDGVSAYGVMMYVSMIFTAVFIGYSIGTSPLFGFNDGAKNYTELRGILKKSLTIVGVTGISMVILAELLAVPLAVIFVGYDEALVEMTVEGFRIFALSFAFTGFGIFASGFFTAMNDGITSALISFVRTMVLESACVILLPKIFGLDGIWYSTVLAEFLAFLLGVWFLVTKRKKYHY